MRLLLRFENLDQSRWTRLSSLSIPTDRFKKIGEFLSLFFKYTFGRKNASAHKRTELFLNAKICTPSIDKTRPMSSCLKGNFCHYIADGLKATYSNDVFVSRPGFTAPASVAISITIASCSSTLLQIPIRIFRCLE